jgi:peptidoglycan L-alanyl-D-glutamate endopeptidase CwlK
MPFTLGTISKRNLVGVHPELVLVVSGAILESEIDFRVHDGVRTYERQRKLVEIGASTTLESKHLVQSDGYGHAVDLVPYVDLDGDGIKELRWDWPLAYQIAQVVQKAAVRSNVLVRWGGCWDRNLNTAGNPADALEKYVQRRRNGGRRVFLDGLHFEKA